MDGEAFFRLAQHGHGETVDEHQIRILLDEACHPQTDALNILIRTAVEDRIAHCTPETIAIGFDAEAVEDHFPRAAARQAL